MPQTAQTARGRSPRTPPDPKKKTQVKANR